MKDQAAESVMVIRKNPRIAFLIIFSELIFTFMVSLFFYLQNYLKDSGRTEFYIGFIYAVSALAAGITGFKAADIDKKIGEKGILLIMPAALLLCLWGTALTDFKELFFILTGVIEGIMIVAISGYINILIPSSSRATVLSFRSMAFSFFMIIFFPVIGWIGDAFSLNSSFVFMACFATFISIFYYIFMRFE